MRRRSLLIVCFLAWAAPCYAKPGYGPWNRDLEIYESPDGARFVKRGTFVERAGVPQLTESNGKLYAVFQWFPLDRPEDFDRIAVSASSDGGKTWSAPQPVVIQGAPPNIFRSFDPVLAALGDGTFRLYFTAERVSDERPRGNRAIFSAVSKNGLLYRFEPGERFGFPDRESYDASVVRFHDEWHLFCPRAPGEAYHAVSRDGLHFSAPETVKLEGSGDWIGNAAEVKGKLRFYGSGPGGIWAAESEDGRLWRIEPSVRLEGGDPAVLPLADGRHLAVVTGGLRPDAVAGGYGEI